MTEENKTFKEIESSIQKELEIDEKNLAGELQRQPSKYFFYGVMWARAAAKLRKVELGLEVLKSELSNKFRQQMTQTDPGIRVTERMLNDFLNECQEFKDANEEAIRAEYAASLYRVARDAFAERHTSLIELTRLSKEQEMYGNEFQVMRDEFEARQKESK